MTRIETNSRINGEFTGCSGESIYELINGQIWKQARFKYKYVYKYCPNAKILNVNGRHYLQVEGMNELIEVRRLL
ncbi:MAG: hypothetical protein R3A80_13970 [Bdellovibrionota bacterium]